MKIRLGDDIVCHCWTVFTVDKQAGRECPSCKTLYKPGDPRPCTSVERLLFASSIEELRKKYEPPLGMFPELPGAQSLAREIDKAIIDYYLREEEE